MSETATTKRRDPAEVRRILERWLPERLDGGALDDLRVAAPQGHGFSNDTLIVDAIVDGAAMPLVVQAAPLGPGLFPEYRIARMARLQQDLRDHTDVPVANVRWVEADPAILGAEFYVMDRLEGRVPDESPKAYHVAGWVAAATSAQRRQLWLSTLEAMAKLHRIDVAAHTGYLCDTRWGMALDADPATERVRQWRDYTEWAADDDEPPPTLMVAWDALLAARPPRPDVLSIGWGDAKLGNVMFSGFDVAALFDWELCGVGPAEEDLMNLLAVDSVLAELFQVPRIDGLCSSDETVAIYERQLDRTMTATNWWHVFAVAKMAAEMDRILRQMRKLGGVPADIDLEATNRAIPRLRRELESL